ncbi:hypothetical protein SAMN04488510_1324 [Fervidobacterium changbaicum]|uniref:Uncharacterized protein n=1 Tax=Fervidobacterium changbaicum TaxID=310769 RepID=A0ABX5QT07_9BACT|nr:hypothetical protein [Fervidobacterium changbaicum]QAV33651.1 hypothetical protein CBS1_07920 [Fervidobacterium changbaicum]SDH76550.1 hypothetical protein SAMN04488510_1324 [Fervidobacterium changbaicum]
MFSTEATEKYNISFNFALKHAGSYTFRVEAKRADGSRVFTSETEQGVYYDQQNIVRISAFLVNGKLRVNIRTEDEIWEKYNVTFDSLKVFSTYLLHFWENLTKESTKVTIEPELYPRI